MESFNPNTIITIVFAFIMMAYWLGAFFILYHLMRFGVGSSPKKMSILFLGGSLFLSIIVVLLYGQISFIQI